MRDRLEWRLAAGAVATVLALGSGCVDDPAPTGFELGEVELRGPAGSGMPSLHAASSGRILLTFLEETEPDRWTLRLAEGVNGAWTEPRTVARRNAFFVNWADFPSAVELGDGSLAVHWLEKVAPLPFAYHVLLTISTDRGETWSQPVVAHRDDSPTEHGFVSMVPWESGAALVWLDGRAMMPDLSAAASDVAPTPADPTRSVGSEMPSPEHGAMSLRATTLDSDGTLGREVLLDDHTCECCQTAMARTREGLVVAYRDRSREEIRDISVVRFDGTEWSSPRTVHADGWEIPGCPVNGPQLAADGDRVAVAWFTGAGGRPQVKVAFSRDGGANWGAPVRVDEGRPVGRVDVALLDDGTAAVSWIEALEEDAAVLLRRVAPRGAMGPVSIVSRTTEGRDSGFPRMARRGDQIVLAWTLAGEDGGVRVQSARPR